MSSNNQNTNLLQVMVSAFSGTHSTTLTIVIPLPAAGTIPRNAPRLGMMVPREAAAPGVQPPMGAAPAASMEIIADDLDTGDMSSRRGRDVPRHSVARSYRSRSRSRRGSHSRRRSRSRRRRQRSRYSPLRNAIYITRQLIDQVQGRAVQAPRRKAAAAAAPAVKRQLWRRRGKREGTRRKKKARRRRRRRKARERARKGRKNGKGRKRRTSPAPEAIQARTAAAAVAHHNNKRFPGYVSLGIY